MVVHDKFDEVKKESTVLALPMTPSRWTGKIEYHPITKITVSCGGGIGGSRWDEYVDRIELRDISTEKMLIVNTINGEERLINPHYIVTAENLTMASAVIDSQNPNFERGLHRYRYLCRDGVKLELVNYF